MESLSLPELLQLADSALPAGGFAFSNGLESLAKLGHLPTLSAFEEYLQGYLEQTGRAELAFLNSFMRSHSGTERADFGEIAEEWNAFLTAPSSRRASLAQGRAWLQLMAGLDSAVEGDIKRRFKEAGSHPEAKLQMHLLPVFGLALAALGASESQARLLFLHTALRDQISSAIRLGLVGSMQGQVLHRAQLKRCERLEREAARLDFRVAVKSAPLLEVAQNHHERLYSRLFQS